MAKVPICLGCWRKNVSMTDDPPVTYDADGRRAWPEEHCALCGYRTNHGIYVSTRRGRADLGAKLGRPAGGDIPAARNRT